MNIFSLEVMPEPSKDDPYAQIKWIFSKKLGVNPSRSARNSYTQCLNKVIRWASEGLGYGVDRLFLLKHAIDEYSLIRFRAFLEDVGVSNNNLSTLISTFRQIINLAIDEKYLGITDYLDSSVASSGRETDARLPYDLGEVEQIENALDSDIKNVRRFLLPYKPTGLGVAPKNRSAEGKRKSVLHGWWRDEDNMRWYFENVLECVPLQMLRETLVEHQGFFSSAQNYHGGINELYNRWGLTSRIGYEHILPYLFKIVSITGLNTSVALNLQIDSYQECHPITGRPYLRYSKLRGSGEAEMHFGLFQSDIQALDGYQNKMIKKLWGELLDLTSRFREKLPVQSRNFLFVYQRKNRKYRERDYVMSSSCLTFWSNDFSRRHKLVGRTGEPLNVTLPRFRPSLVSQLLRRGVDIYIVKDILGHASILTTFRYIDSYDFNPIARKEVKAALSMIRNNARDFQINPKPIALDSSQHNDVIFSTPLSMCKNVFSPPSNIRKAAGIGEGCACTIFNMCLRCPNVLILKENLPSLFALRAQYLVAFEQGVSSTPHRAALQQNLHILNGLLDSETSDWAIEDLLEAERASLNVNEIVDTIVLRSVM